MAPRLVFVPNPTPATSKVLILRLQTWACSMDPNLESLYTHYILSLNKSPYLKPYPNKEETGKGYQKPGHDCGELSTVSQGAFIVCCYSRSSVLQAYELLSIFLVSPKGVDPILRTLVGPIVYSRYGTLCPSKAWSYYPFC